MSSKSKFYDKEVTYLETDIVQVVNIFETDLIFSKQKFQEQFYAGLGSAGLLFKQWDGNSVGCTCSGLD